MCCPKSLENHRSHSMDSQLGRDRAVRWSKRCRFTDAQTEAQGGEGLSSDRRAQATSGRVLSLVSLSQPPAWPGSTIWAE